MRRALLIVFAGVLAGACGGGGGIALGPSDGGVGSGGTGAVASVVASGPIEGFGSIIVNGVRYEIDTARAELRDTSQLKLGMTVQITGTVSTDLRTGTASVVTSTTQAKGPVSNLDRTGRSFTVLGLRVTVDETTVFADAKGLDALSDATPVQVWGIARAGALLATRVERQPVAAAAEQVITDTARELDPGGRSFKVGSLVVSYPSGIPAEVATALTAGAPVRVRGTVDAAGTGLVASSVEPAEPKVPAEPTVLSLSGNVTAWTGSRFTLDGYTVDATAAQITGGRNRLDEGARVDVVGPVQGNVLAATRIRVRQTATTAPQAATSPAPAASAPAPAVPATPTPAASAPAVPASALAPVPAPVTPPPAPAPAPAPQPAPPAAPTAPAAGADLPASPATSATPAPASEPTSTAAPAASTTPSPVLAAGTFSASGTIASFVSDARFDVQHQAVDASAPDTVFVKGTRRELATGRKVQVTGTTVRGDVLIAERVEFIDR
jgi:hypothetical protein